VKYFLFQPATSDPGWFADLIWDFPARLAAADARDRLWNCLERGRRVSDLNECVYLFAVRVYRKRLVDLGLVPPGQHAVSPRLWALLERHAPGAAQFLPFRMRTVYGDKLATGYCLVNYLRWVDCIDRERSEIDLSSDVVDPKDPWAPYNELGDVVFKKVVLRRRKIGDTRLFRFRGNSEQPVMREDLRDTLLEARITGISFTPIEVVGGGGTCLGGEPRGARLGQSSAGAAAARGGGSQAVPSAVWARRLI
jgi:hypothetical protein